MISGNEIALKKCSVYFHTVIALLVPCSTCIQYTHHTAADTQFSHIPASSAFPLVYSLIFSLLGFCQLLITMITAIVLVSSYICSLSDAKIAFYKCCFTKICSKIKMYSNIKVSEYAYIISTLKYDYKPNVLLIEHKLSLNYY